MDTAEYDYILVGGGLQNGLITLALRTLQPKMRIALVERDAKLGGSHIWCFHAGDLSDRALEWIAPLVFNRWPGYTVRFPDFQRAIDIEYSAISSDRLNRVVQAAVEDHAGSRVFLDAEADRVDSNEVHLIDGRVLTGKIVIDARGPERSDASGATAGFQKFVGLEVELTKPHGLEIPTLMDATVDQTEGFRFFYTLPLEADKLLIEDTYFHQSPDLKVEAVRAEIMKYAEKMGYEINAEIREETGVLPMTWTGSLPKRSAGPMSAGFQGGWFHPATGYSLPIAARVAEYISGQALERLQQQGLDALIRPHHAQARFCHLLNRFLFRWYAPRSRWHIFKRFYTLPISTISRFYALRLTWGDRFRLLVGRPPRGFSLRYRFRGGVAS